MYSKAQANWSAALRSTCPSGTGSQQEFKESANSALQLQINAYSDFLESFANLARSAWTEFDLWSMGVGLLLMILSVITQACVLLKLNTICQHSDQERASSRIIPKFSFAFTLVAIRAASFLSNSYICEFVKYTSLTLHFEIILVYLLICHFVSCHAVAEGRVANFLLATSCIASVWHSTTKGKFSIEVNIPVTLNLFKFSHIHLNSSFYYWCYNYLLMYPLLY